MMLTLLKDCARKLAPTLTPMPRAAPGHARATAHPGLLRRQWALDHYLRAHLYALRHLPQTLAGSLIGLTPYLNLTIQREQGEIPDATLLQQCHCDASHFNQYQLDTTMWMLTTLSS